MKKQYALKAIMYISILGILFSGYLSYTEIFRQFCAFGTGTCSDVFKIPACVYGLAMYIVLFILSLAGINAKS